ncbi:MAG: leucine efflux protein LeuE [Burkholderiaceae bacterium]
MSWLGITDVWLFAVAVIVFLAIPGPGTFALLTSTAKGGKRGGYAALGGVIVGDQILLWLAVAGVAALLATNPTLFKFVQYAGAAYLVWIGLSLLRAKGGTGFIEMKMGQWFRQGLLITVLNPKAIVFYMAFFPQFIDPATQQGVVTFAAMAVIIALLTLIYCTGIIFVGDAMARRLQANSTVDKWLERAAGVFLVGFGIRLGTN